MGQQHISLHDVLGAIAADLALVGLDFDAGVLDLARDEWIAGKPSAVADGFPRSGFVMVLRGLQTLLDTDAEGTPSAVSIADIASEWAMDELGHGWPELADSEGDFVCLLQPAAGNSGPVWAGGGVSVPLGSLSTVPLVRASASDDAAPSDD
ncbi:hypothetical protein [Demequina sp. NBRC 110052]|uniref:hypothetical protein n=1 Tax=Demequina sp. NBRC 110052 TaxID=1570341 RepID=UPI0009FE8D26|nr:hypothetical protein [Demequina sp. NBRC 110052]